MTTMAQKFEFKADVYEMSPMSYRARAGLSGFSFEMRNDSAFVHLPYMDEVYSQGEQRRYRLSPSQTPLPQRS